MIMKLPVKKSLSFLDGLRGLAALYVATGHARWLLWEGGDNFKQLSHTYSTAGKMLAIGMSVFKYGHEMVLFFFVLSGFVIHLRYSLQLSKGEEAPFSFGSYFFKRLKRIMPPYLFVFALTFICDSIVAHNQYSIYTHTTPLPLVNQNIVFVHSWSSLIGNIFFLQDAYVPVFGSNGSIWSLKYEWYFYMLYPVLLFFNRKSPWFTLIGLSGIFLIYLIGFHTGFVLFDQVVACLLSWWVGGFVADIYNGRVQIKRYFLYPLAVIIPLIPLIHTSGINNLLKDQIVAFGFTGLLVLLLDYRDKRIVQSFGKLKWLGDCSYTLYLIHAPLLILANGILLKATNNVMPKSFVYVWLAVIGVVIIAYGLHFIVEKPFVSAAKRVPLKQPDVVPAMVK
ncbi:Peptidoglycan/LPS O-acetylase OafA/YrhL, contains acyltransferase and SGNH-hydrolase domains [Chitinophaga sp. YR573]|uniref:acyltransferase family protein n=1 Tax=Chitinophaga sp. YR573 TaxID=1881040 RepID=UPI0008C26069|nr:acyltransferase [Chitinophaga sp. YR573]SEW27420.1 Peptidoglycan/LPS O-acetylase OafA/YrhL, contains acyltransferase and SGNH-hydrolase domains [Chitinophaga sp. YR573]